MLGRKEHQCFVSALTGGLRHKKSPTLSQALLNLIRELLQIGGTRLTPLFSLEFGALQLKGTTTAS